MRMLSGLLAPLTPDEFWEEYFEQKPLLVSRHNSSFYDSLLTMESLAEMLDCLGGSGKLVVNEDVDFYKGSFSTPMSFVDASSAIYEYARQMAFDAYLDGYTVKASRRLRNTAHLHWLPRLFFPGTQPPPEVGTCGRALRWVGR
jgi:hypothetical protein